jgi:hypothetical protein
MVDCVGVFVNVREGPMANAARVVYSEENMFESGGVNQSGM